MALIIMDQTARMLRALVGATQNQALIDGVRELLTSGAYAVPDEQIRTASQPPAGQPAASNGTGAPLPTPPPDGAQ